MLPKWRAIVVCLLLVWTVASGCAQNEARLGDVVGPDSGSGPSSFTPEPGSDAAVDAPIKSLMCIGTSCPAPFATCFAEEGPTHKCGIDLSRDPDNCGACGNKCLVYDPIALSSRCVDGACELECLNKSGALTDFRNCNLTVDDGCESDVTSDAKNCGLCGNACAAGSSCIKGRCGCPSGLIECPGPDGVPRCTNPKSDDANCGGCGNECAPPAEMCSPMPNRAYYGCGGGTCGQLKCGGYSSDCNGDMAALACNSDGCEVEDVRTDKNNCGGCGIKCTGAQECIDEGNGYECAVPCARFGKTACPDGRCVDLLSDVYSCGGCNNACPNAGPHQVRSCNKGLCAYECAPGFADCNGSAADGCEVNLQTHAGNCGACGASCDVAAGQPCVGGKCLMTDCDAGVTK
jgi:hypothetical protein